MDWTGNGVAVRSERAARVAEWFGVRGNEEFRMKSEELKTPDVIRAQRIILLTGASGAGKSSLLREMRKQCDFRWIDLTKIRLPEVPVVDCFGDEPLENVLRDLGRVGLGEVWTYLRLPSELSEGQRWRLRLAIALHRVAPSFNGAPTCREQSRTERRVPVVISADEFAAVLDRVTAKVVARCVRRAVSASSNVCAVLATSHDDLRAALEPDVLIQCDFGAVAVLDGAVAGATTTAGCVAG